MAEGEFIPNTSPLMRLLINPSMVSYSGQHDTPVGAQYAYAPNAGFTYGGDQGGLGYSGGSTEQGSRGFSEGPNPNDNGAIGGVAAPGAPTNTSDDVAGDVAGPSAASAAAAQSTGSGFGIGITDHLAGLLADDDPSGSGRGSRAGGLMGHLGFGRGAPTAPPGPTPTAMNQPTQQQQDDLFSDPVFSGMMEKREPAMSLADLQSRNDQTNAANAAAGTGGGGGSNGGVGPGGAGDPQGAGNPGEGPGGIGGADSGWKFGGYTGDDTDGDAEQDVAGAVHKEEQVLIKEANPLIGKDFADNLNAIVGDAQMGDEEKRQALAEFFMGLARQFGGDGGVGEEMPMGKMGMGDKMAGMMAGMD